MSDPANRMEGAAGLDRILQPRLEGLDVVRMQIVTHELLFAHGAVSVRPSKDFVHAVVLPDHMVRERVPFKDAKRCAARCNAQPRLAFLSAISACLRSVTSKLTPKMRFDLMSA